MTSSPRNRVVALLTATARPCNAGIVQMPLWSRMANPGKPPMQKRGGDVLVAAPEPNNKRDDVRKRPRVRFIAETVLAGPVRFLRGRERTNR